MEFTCPSLLLAYLSLLPLEVIELDAIFVVLVHEGGEGDDASPAPRILQLGQQQVRQQEPAQMVHLEYLQKSIRILKTTIAQCHVLQLLYPGSGCIFFQNPEPYVYDLIKNFQLRGGKLHKRLSVLTVSCCATPSNGIRAAN
jgi:hypothetical protein